MKKIGLLLILVMTLCSGTAHAVTIQEVTSKNGLKAWLVQDKNLPLIAMRFAFRGGVEQDPVDKQGLANLTMDLLTEGAGPYDNAAFQKMLADHAVALSFSAGRDEIGGSLKTLSAEQGTAFDLLHLALTQAHFDPKDIDRARNQQLVMLRSQLGSPDWQARYSLFRQIFGDHPYGERRLGSTATLASLTRDDIKAFASDHIAQDNLVVAVAGDIDPAALSDLLDKVFGDLPKHAVLRNVSEISWPKDPSVLLVPREGTQTELLFAMPAPKRDDPDWYAAEIADYVLGSGGFSSRLMQDVRDKNGLTYGISTGISPMEHGSLFIGEAATDNAKTGKAWSIALETMQKFYREGPTDKEVDAAKDYLTGALPLEMTSTDKIAGVLAELQIEHLAIDYLDKRNDLLRHVTKEDLARVIQRWFNPKDLTLSMVGKPDGPAATKTQDQTRD